MSSSSALLPGPQRCPHPGCPLVFLQLNDLLEHQASHLSRISQPPVLPPMTSLPPLHPPSFLPTQLPPISNFAILPPQQAPSSSSSSSFLPPILQQQPILPPMRLPPLPENSAFHILAGLASAIPQKPVEWTEDQIMARSNELLSTTSEAGKEFDLFRFSLVNKKGDFVMLTDVDDGHTVYGLGFLKNTKLEEIPVRLGMIIQWGGCYDVERNFERNPTVVLRTAQAHYHLKDASEPYFRFFEELYRKIALTSYTLRWIVFHENGTLAQFFHELHSLRVTAEEVGTNLHFMISQIDILNIQKISGTPLVTELKNLLKSLPPPPFKEKRKKAKKEHKRHHEKEKEKEKERVSKKRKADETHPQTVETAPFQDNPLPLTSGSPRQPPIDLQVEKEKKKEKAESRVLPEPAPKNPIEAEDHRSDGLEDNSISIVDPPVVNLKEEEEEDEEEPPVVDEVTFLQTHHPLPEIPAIQGSFPKELVGDLLSIMEFVSAFGEDLSLHLEDLPAGRLAEMISGRDFVSLVLNLTKVLVQELAEQEEPYNKKPAKKDDSITIVLPDDQREGKEEAEEVVEEPENEKAFRVSTYSLLPSAPWHDIPLRDVTVAEVLRLYIIAKKYSQQNHLIMALFATNIYDFGLKLRVELLRFLCDEILATEGFYEKIENAIQRIKDLNYEIWRNQTREKKIDKEIADIQRDIKALRKEKDEITVKSELEKARIVQEAEQAELREDSKPSAPNDEATFTDGEPRPKSPSKAPSEEKPKEEGNSEETTTETAGSSVAATSSALSAVKQRQQTLDLAKALKSVDEQTALFVLQKDELTHQKLHEIQVFQGSKKPDQDASIFEEMKPLLKMRRAECLGFDRLERMYFHLSAIEGILVTDAEASEWFCVRDQELFGQLWASLSKSHPEELKLRKGIEKVRSAIEESLLKCQDNSSLAFNIWTPLSIEPTKPSSETSKAPENSDNEGQPKAPAAEAIPTEQGPDETKPEASPPKAEEKSESTSESKPKPEPCHADTTPSVDPTKKNWNEIFQQDLVEQLKDFSKFCFQAFGHLTKVKRSKRLESETELLELLGEANTFSLLAVYLARLIRWLEARGALERDSYSFTGRQVHSIPQLALEFYSARVIVDWSVARFHVAECQRPHRGQKLRQCTRCRVVVLCECKVDDLDTDPEEWICDRCSWQEVTFLFPMELAESNHKFFGHFDPAASENLKKAVLKLSHPEEMAVNQPKKEKATSKKTISKANSSAGTRPRRQPNERAAPADLFAVMDMDTDVTPSKAKPAGKRKKLAGKSPNFKKKPKRKAHDDENFSDDEEDDDESSEGDEDEEEEEEEKQTAPPKKRGRPKKADTQAKEEPKTPGPAKGKTPGRKAKQPESPEPEKPQKYLEPEAAVQRPSRRAAAPIPQYHPERTSPEVSPAKKGPQKRKAAQESPANKKLKSESPLPTTSRAHRTSQISPPKKPVVAIRKGKRAETDSDEDSSEDDDDDSDEDDKNRPPDPCMICGDPDSILVRCDICHKTSHPECMTPPRPRAPRGPWHCGECAHLVKGLA